MVRLARIQFCNRKQEADVEGRGQRVGMAATACVNESATIRRLIEIGRFPFFAIPFSGGSLLFT
jgi:hypothetical protein